MTSRATIAADGPFTVLVELRVANPAGTDALVQRLGDTIAEDLAQRPGFITAALHVTSDRTRILNYAQWTSWEHWQEATGVRDTGDASLDHDYLARRADDTPAARVLAKGGVVLERVSRLEVARVVTPPDDPPHPDRPALHRDDPAALDAVHALVAALQHGLNTADADRYDAQLAADVLWGTPKGQVVDGTDQLLPIHRKLMAQAAAPLSRFELVSWRAPADGVAVAQILRRALDPEAFSEVAVYTLVRQHHQWWVTAAQNTPVTAIP